MKKKLLSLILASLMLTGIAPLAHASTADVTITIDGVYQRPSDQEPFLDTAASRVVVPLRFVSESLGHSVDWDGDTQTITIDGVWTHVVGTNTITNKNTGVVNTFDTPSYVDTATNRTIVPVRFVSEILGYKVDWIGKTNTVNVVTKEVTFDPNGAFDPYVVNPEWVWEEWDVAKCTDWQGDVPSFGRINAECAVAIAEYAFANLKFVKENGKYYMVGKLPILSPGDISAYSFGWSFVMSTGTIIVTSKAGELLKKNAASRANYIYTTYTADGSFRLEIPASMVNFTWLEADLGIKYYGGYYDGDSNRLASYAYNVNLGDSQITDGDYYAGALSNPKIPGGMKAIFQWGIDYPPTRYKKGE